jgi:hypothetical protein
MFMRIDLSMGLSAIATPWVYDIQTPCPSPFPDQGFLRAVPVEDYAGRIPENAKAKLKEPGEDR